MAKDNKRWGSLELPSHVGASRFPLHQETGHLKVNTAVLAAGLQEVPL